MAQKRPGKAAAISKRGYFTISLYKPVPLFQNCSFIVSDLINQQSPGIDGVLLELNVSWQVRYTKPMMETGQSSGLRSNFFPISVSVNYTHYRQHPDVPKPCIGNSQSQRNLTY